ADRLAGLGVHRDSVPAADLLGQDTFSVYVLIRLLAHTALGAYALIRLVRHHALGEQALERLVDADVTGLVHRAGEEARIKEMQQRVLDAADILIERQPIACGARVARPS